MKLIGAGLKVTSPAGLWEYPQLIGASVKIASKSVSSGFFAVDSEDIYTIKEIGFRISKYGKSYTVVTLNELPGKEFAWKDLEIIGLPFCIYCPAICGGFCCGGAICGYNIGNIPGEHEINVADYDNFERVNEGGYMYRIYGYGDSGVKNKE